MVRNKVRVDSSFRKDKVAALDVWGRTTVSAHSCSLHISPSVCLSLPLSYSELGIWGVLKK